MRDIVNHMNKLEHTVSVLAEIILEKAGETLSKMLTSKHGYFSKSDVIGWNPELVKNFAAVYNEFMTMGYPNSLIRSITHEIVIQKLKTGWIDCHELMIMVLSQFGKLFDERYIKSTA